MSLLMNPKIIYENKLSNIDKKLKKIKNKEKTAGLIIIINESTLETLKNKKGKNSKLEYLNSNAFVNSIKFNTFVYFDKKVCILSKDSIMYLDVVIKNTMRYLPNNLTIIYPYESRDSNILILNGFKKDNTWTRKNDMSYKSPFFTDNSFDKIHNEKICKIKIKLSKDTIQYIKELSKRGSFYSSGKIKQKELGGEMYVSNITEQNIHVLNIKSLKHGGDDHVKIDQTLISFHTHPIESYDKYKVINGWPSHSDYCSVLSQGHHKTLIHFVISVEGLYIIAFSKEWIQNNLKYHDEIKNTIKDCKALDKNNKKNSLWHVKEVNKLKYKNVKIFNNYFFKWSNIKIFDVYMINKSQFCKIGK